MGDHFSLFGHSEFTVDGLGEERRGVKKGGLMGVRGCDIR